jgi:hypothetical protein
MKKILLLSSIVILSLLNASAQVIADQVEMGSGYANQVFYHFNGTKTSVAADAWDLGFSTSLFQVAVISNQKNITVYKIEGVDSSAYASISDTAGLVLVAQYNSEDDWYAGAFNRGANEADPFDFGWGIYDFVSHTVFGNKLFIVTDGSAWYKFWIRYKSPDGTFALRYANLNGGADANLYLNTALYPAKNYVYLTLESGAISDLEPAATDWQLLFTQYITDFPGLGPYLVTGILQHPEILTAEASGVDVNTVSYLNYSAAYSTSISEIGYDWKYFDLNIFQYVIEDSLIYFVKDAAQNIVSIRFTGFDNVTGTSAFETEQLLTGISNIAGDIIQAGVYPNPAGSTTQLVYDANEATTVQLTVVDLMGRTVQVNTVKALKGFNQESLDLSGLISGMYHLVLTAGEQRIALKLQVL